MTTIKIDIEKINKYSDLVSCVLEFDVIRSLDNGEIISEKFDYITLNRYYICKICGEKFDTIEYLNDHIQEHDLPEIYEPFSVESANDIIHEELGSLPNTRVEWCMYDIAFNALSDIIKEYPLSDIDKLKERIKSAIKEAKEKKESLVREDMILIFHVDKIEIFVHCAGHICALEVE